MSSFDDPIRRLSRKMRADGDLAAAEVAAAASQEAQRIADAAVAASNPMTSVGDLIVGGTAGAPTRLGAGTEGYVLTVGPGGVLEWAPALQGFYAAGTWTPALQGQTTPGTYTYTTQYGVWRRVGDLVFVLGRFQINAVLSAGTGNALITGLPFPALATGGPGFGLNVAFIGVVNWSGAHVPHPRVLQNSTQIRLEEPVDNGPPTILPVTAFAATSIIDVSGVYITE